jgi:hypothetical protein
MPDREQWFETILVGNEIDIIHTRTPQLITLSVPPKTFKTLFTIIAHCQNSLHDGIHSAGKRGSVHARNLVIINGHTGFSANLAAYRAPPNHRGCFCLDVHTVADSCGMNLSNRRVVARIQYNSG